eukprot:TRINITY_DN19184_c0_g1_i1.p4 TRINITY_DN19184_c0_g1~~TRINITY_DN19184_c0_g1_i1.p4  ORF type:complete len:103 (+),score=18.67 TRINITY_DN19184_c0_g1_i1:131-439(+)
MLSSGHHNCAIRDFDTKDWTQFQLKVLEKDGEQDLCPVWGESKLQDLAYRYQVKARGLPQSQSKYPCLLYTSDAADEEDSVDRGGRPSMKKKTQDKAWTTPM